MIPELEASARLLKPKSCLFRGAPEARSRLRVSRPPSEDSPGEASGDSGPDASSPDKAEPGLRDYGQTGVFYLVSEPEEMGAGEAREAASGPDLEPEEALPVAPPAEGAAGRGSESLLPMGPDRDARSPGYPAGMTTS